MKRIYLLIGVAVLLNLSSCIVVKRVEYKDRTSIEDKTDMQESENKEFQS